MSKPYYLLFHKDHPLYPKGVNSGAEMATRSLARALREAGRDVVVCGELPEGTTTVDGVEYWDIGSEFNVAEALERAATRGSYHLISAGRAYPILASRGESACFSRTLVCHDPTGGATGINNGALCRIVDKIICVSHAQKELFVQSGADSSKIEVVHNGVALELFTRSQDAQRDLKKIIFVGALVPHKGAHVLIEAFAHLKSRMPEVTLDIYGSSGLWGAESYLDEKDIAAKCPGITFHGARPQQEIVRALQSAGVAVCPSIWFEALGLASLEAQACGCPVVAFNMGGLRETMIVGETGVLVDEPSVKALEEALTGLLSDPRKMISMGEKAAQWISENFSWTRAASSVITMTESLQKSRPIPKIGVMTTWNQQCGLATYAGFLFSQFSPEDVVIFGEDIGHGYTGADGPNVVRCWKRTTSDLSRLEEAVARHEIDILHLNFHDHQFFPHETLFEVIARCRSKGIRVISHLHTTFTEDPRMKRFIGAIDGIIVHSPESRLQVIANGGAPENVWVLPHGVHRRKTFSEVEKQRIREKFKIPLAEKVVVSVGFVQPNKGMEGVIEAVAHLIRNGIPARGYIVGKVPEHLPSAADYFIQLKLLAERAGVKDNIYFLNRFASEDEVSHYLGISDLVLMNYQSQYYEASGACSIAIGAGCLVATSLAPQFSVFGDAVWHMTSGFPPGISAHVLLGTDPKLRTTIFGHAKRYLDENAWPRIAEKLSARYRTLSERSKSNKIEIAVPTKECTVELKNNVTTSATPKKIKVLFQNRHNAFTQRGGDTVVMERLMEGLTKRGMTVTVDLEGRANPKDFDVVHLFNFVLADLTRHFAEQAHRAGVPFVVTTLSEDVPAFHNQSHAVAAALVEYQRRNQSKEWWNIHKVDVATIARSGRFENTWIAENATALLTNGAQESAVIRRDYPQCGTLVEISLGCDVRTGADPELFTKQYGIKDFVFCVGRLESRKNQLMLLKALEQSELPVVLAAGGFSYQPEYQKAVEGFQRKGRTIVLGRISDEMLASAYAAAKVHALPSWYELPGLVSLEAARFGCNVVVTANGTAPDYFGDLAFYCTPHDERSIHTAVMAAYYSPTVEGLRARAEQFTWEKTIKETCALYEEIVARKTQVQEARPAGRSERDMSQSLKQSVATPSYDMNSASVEFQEVLERGELAAKNREFAKAHELLSDAERLNPDSARGARCRGAVYLAEGNHEKAAIYFERALTLDPDELRAQSGAGMCDIMAKRFESGYRRFLKVLEKDPYQQVAMMQLLECSYALNRFDDLEGVLRRFLTNTPADTSIQYCLAGCLYKRGDYDGAEEWLKKVREAAPSQKGIAELQAVITSERLAAAAMKKVESSRIPPATTVLDPEQELAFERRINELSEMKRKREYAAVRMGADQLLTEQKLNSDQRERALLLRADAHVGEGNLVGAEYTFDGILAANSSSPRALCGKGALAAARSEWEKAKNFFEKAQHIDPSYDVALAGRGICAVQEGNSEEGWTYYLAASKKNPENIRALLGLIELGYPLGRLAAVQGALEAYLDLHPADLDFLYALAGCFYAQGMLRETIDAVDRITLFNPTHERALELRDMVRTKTSHVEVRSAV